ncbi:MAG: hypothetical protein WDN48_06340 [Pseudolabrys sp.]
MTLRERLNNLQIIILRSLIKRGGNVTPVSIPAWQRKAAVTMWRRGLIEVWFRKSRDGCAGSGPFFLLTIFGARLALEFYTRRLAVHQGRNKLNDQPSESQQGKDRDGA